MNLLLLCHGAPREVASFELKAGQTVQYRGNFGTNLSASVARALVGALVSDPYVGDQQLAHIVSGYTAQPPLEGPRSFKPDISLGGDNPQQCLCFVMNMTGRNWFPLDGSWHSSLNAVVASCPSPLWLNFLCCTFIDENVQKAFLRSEVRVRNWSDILR
jgi:hypothetical protein